MYMWRNRLRADPTPWLLEDEPAGIEYLTLRLLSTIKTDPSRYETAKAAAYERGPIAEILSNMDNEGFWLEPGPGYLPKYRSIVWSLIGLAQLGAEINHDVRIEKACSYLLEHALNPDGQFSSTGPPSGTVDCLQGNLCAALLDLGCTDERLWRAFEWMARTVTGEGLAPNTERMAPLRYYAGKCGPVFECGANNKLSCAWGATKVMLAFGKLPMKQRDPLVEAAINVGVGFLFSVDPSTAAYPSGWANKPSGNWWKFGFPVFYVTDILQIVEALCSLGYGRDERLQNAIDFILEKQDDQGRWPLEYDYAGKTWVDFGVKKSPNKWVTLRVLHSLKHCEA
jgi:hypothetical protein